MELFNHIMLTGPDSCLLLLVLFPGVVPRGGNGKHCSIEQWLNYSISTHLLLKGKFFFSLFVSDIEVQFSYLYFVI